jgi:hypothetical protein
LGAKILPVELTIISVQVATAPTNYYFKGGSVVCHELQVFAVVGGACNKDEVLTVTAFGAGDVHESFRYVLIPFDLAS